MKKLFLVLFAVVLALSLVTCDVFAPPPVAENDVLDDGLGPLQPGEFFIGVQRPSGRALTAPLARAGADYFEVVFHDKALNLFERVAFTEGSVVRMRAPTYDEEYDNIGNYVAYVFAGRNESKMLLGIGMIYSVDGVVGETEITADTTDVIFKLEALTTDIHANNTTSTFTIGGGGVSVIDEPVVGQTFNVPVFIVPNNRNDLTGSFKFKITNNHSFSVNLFDSILWTAGGTVTTREAIFESKETQLSSVTASNVAVAITGSNPTAAEIDVTFDIVSPAKDGLGILYIDIPVCLLDPPGPSSPAAVTWRLRGGLNNAMIDVGPTHNYGDGSLGGAVFIGIGNVFSGSGFIIGHQNQ